MAEQSSPPAVPEADQWAETEFSVVKFMYRWTIHKIDFYLDTITNCQPQESQVFESPSFSSGEPGDELVWQIKATIKVEKTVTTYSTRTATNMYFTLVLQSGTTNTGGTSAISAHVHTYILGAEKQKITIADKRNLYKAKGEYQVGSFSYNTPRLSEGNLILFCEIETQRTDKPRSTTGSRQVAMESDVFDSREIIQDFGALLEDGVFSDATVVAGERQFRVHKAILSTRSSVFRAMFDHDMQESVQNRVAIDDLSLEVVQEMLTFIYTGRSPNLKKMPGDLLRAADKYDLKQLKAQSERELADRVSRENLVDTLLLADQHSATELREVCTKLFTIHAEEVVKTEGWSKLIQSGHQLITELVVIQAKKLVI